MASLIVNPFPTLVGSIPVANHAIEVEAAFWQQPMQHAGLSTIHQTIFGSRASIRLTRQSVQASTNPLRKCAEVLLWGYPTGMRGRQHIDFLANLNQISSTGSNFQNGWPAYYNALHGIGNLGISTITKLAYFYGAKFNNFPALILDRRIIEVLAANTWSELSGFSNLTYCQASGRYLDYLQTTETIAKRMNVQQEQLEFFLFSLGGAFA